MQALATLGNPAPQPLKMKSMKKILIYLPVFFALFVASCSDDNEVSPKDEKVKHLTSSAWTTASVLHSTDGDLTSQYANYSITFSRNASSGIDGDYLVTNGSYAFPDAAGKWTLSADLSKITLTNGQEIAIESLSDESLKFKVVVAPSSGRVSGLSGEFHFSLKH